MMREIAEKIVRLTDEFGELGQSYIALQEASDQVVVQGMGASAVVVALSKQVVLQGILARRAAIIRSLRFHGVHLAPDQA